MNGAGATDNSKSEKTDTSVDVKKSDLQPSLHNPVQPSMSKNDAPAGDNDAAGVNVKSSADAKAGDRITRVNSETTGESFSKRPRLESHQPGRTEPAQRPLHDQQDNVKSEAARAANPPFESKIAFTINVWKWIGSEQSRAERNDVSEPREVACFSKGVDKKIAYGNRKELKKFVQPRIGANLGDKIESFVRKEETKPPIETVLKALQTKAFNLRQEADVVTYRNNLNKIGGTVFNQRSDWELECVLDSGTLFLDVCPTHRDPESGMHLQYMYYGYRFESVCTGTEHESVNTNAEFCSVVRLRIGQFRIILSAEIDCTDGNPENLNNPVQQYVELKTMKELRTEKDYHNMYRYRFPKYWLQSYLGGVRYITVGLRSESGHLAGVNRMQTQHLHRDAVDFYRGNYRRTWDPQACIGFIHHVLDQMRKACSENPGATIRVCYDPKKGEITGTVCAPAGEGLGARILDARRG